MNDPTKKKPSRAQAEAAVKTLLEYIGEDPKREGLQDTPKRVIKAYDEWFNGYDLDPKSLLSTTFSDNMNYDDIIIVKDIRLESYCEHHLAPIIGNVHIAYLPDDKVLGLSKLARIVDCFAKRLQMQEKLTAQIAHAIQEHLNPKGTGVIIDAIHHCLTTRGAHKSNSLMRTQTMLGCFKSDKSYPSYFVNMIKD